MINARKMHELVFKREGTKMHESGFSLFQTQENCMAFLSEVKCKNSMGSHKLCIKVFYMNNYKSTRVNCTSTWTSYYEYCNVWLTLVLEVFSSLYRWGASFFPFLASFSSSLDSNTLFKKDMVRCLSVVGVMVQIGRLLYTMRLFA